MNKWDWKIKTKGRYNKCDGQLRSRAGVHQGWVCLML